MSTPVLGLPRKRPSRRRSHATTSELKLVALVIAAQGLIADAR